MDEIRALQKRLADAIAGASTARLSERNVVELVEKLKQMGLLNDLIFTVDGKEFITKKQVGLELGDELLLAGGRLALPDIVESLGVDILHIEQAAIEIVKKDNDVYFVNGELVASYYLDTICEEINELLVEAGQVPLDVLSKRFSLTNDFLRQAIEPRLGIIIMGKLDKDDTLYTQAFIERLTAQLLGAINGVIWPIRIDHLRKACGMGEEARFHSTLRELNLPGVLQGMSEKATYTPAVFGRAQKAWIDSAFRRDGYLEYKALDQLKISNPASFVKKRFEGQGVSLDSMYIANHVVESVTASINEMAESNTVMDILDTVPFPMSDDDADLLLSISLDADKITVVCDSFVIGSGLIETLKINCEGWVMEQVKLSASKKKEAKPISTPTPVVVQSKKPRRRARKDKGEPVDPKPAAKQPFDNLSVEMLAKQIVVWDRQLGQEPDKVIEAMAELLYPFALECRDEAVKSLFAATSVALHKKRQSIYDELIAAVTALHCHMRALDVYRGEGKAQLTKHVYKTDGQTALHCLLAMAAIDGGSEDGELLTSSIDRSRVLQLIPVQQRKHVFKLSDIIVKEDVDIDLEDSLRQCCDELSIFIPVIDRKREKAYVSAWKEGMMESIRTEESPPDLLLAVVQKVYCECMGGQVAVTTTGRSVSKVLDVVTRCIGSSHGAVLKGFHHLVVILLNLDERNEEDRERVVAELTTLMPQIRSIGGLTSGDI